MVQNGTNLLKRETDLEAKLRSLIEAELQKIKEQQSQSSKNQIDKISKIEQVCVEMNKKFMSDMNQINSKSSACLSYFVSYQPQPSKIQCTVKILKLLFQTRQLQKGEGGCWSTFSLVYAIECLRRLTKSVMLPYVDIQ